MSPNRVVVTGTGVLTPIGNSVPEFWENAVKGVSGAARISHFDPTNFDTQIACEIKEFDPKTVMDPKDIRRTDRYTHYAFAAVKEAMAQSRLNPGDVASARAGVIIGSGIGGIETLTKQHSVLLDKGPGRVSPFFIPMMISNIASGRIAIEYGFRGPNWSIVSACASSAHSIGDGFLQIRWGEADVMIVGGSESPIIPLAVAGFCTNRALSTRNDEPKRASRPFDAKRDGFVIGEGAGILILESESHAKARGANILAELAGFAATADAFHITAPHPDGIGAIEVMEKAIKNAGLSPEDIDYINAHGTSTLVGDISEAKAINKLFDKRRVKVSSTKSMIGHLLGAAGAVEAIAAIMSITTGTIHPTINYDYPDPECDIDVVPNEAIKFPVRAALSNAFGFGGHNAALVFKAYEP